MASRVARETRDRTSLARWRSAKRPAGRESRIDSSPRPGRGLGEGVLTIGERALTPLPRLREKGLGVGAAPALSEGIS